MINEITIFCTLIAIVSAVLMFLVVARIVELNKVYKTTRQKRKQEGLSDLLLYAGLAEDGIVQCKSGTLMAAWIYEGSDHHNETDENLNYICGKLNAALVTLGSEWTLNVDSIRVEAPQYSERGKSYFPDPVSYAIDEERRRYFTAQGNMFEGAHVLTLTYNPPSLREGKLVEMLYDDDRKDIDLTSSGPVKLFKRQIEHVENILSTVLNMQRLKAVDYVFEDGSIQKHDEFLQFLQYCITGLSHPIQLPSVGMYLDCLLGGQDLYTGTIPKIGDKFIQVVSIDGFPSDSYPTILTALSDIGVNCRFSTRFSFMEGYQAESVAGVTQKKWKQKEKGLKDVITNNPNPQLDEDAILMAQDAGSGLTEIRSGMVSYGYYTACLVLMDEDREALQQSARDVEKMFLNRGFSARIETVNTLEAYLGSLPAHVIPNVRRFFISTMNLAHLLPTSSIWTGENDAPCPFYPAGSPALMNVVTNGTTPYRLNLHVRDVGHTLILGPTGAGKSALLALLAAQALRYRDASIFAFDKGRSMYPLCKAVGGTFYNIGADGCDLSFAPYKYLATKEDTAWLLDWNDKILALNGVITTPEQRLEMQNAILRLAETQHHTPDLSLTNFRSQVQSKEIQEVLKQYDTDSPMGKLLSGKRDNLSISKFTLFEIETLLTLGDRWALPVLDYVFRRIQLSLKGQPAFLFLDEAWIMFQNPVFMSKIIEWLKVFRKANCSVILSTQSFSDAFNPALMSALVEYTASKIFLPNVYAKNPEFAEQFKRLGLNSQQVNILAEATPKRDYYHLTSKGARLCDLALGPLFLAFGGSSDADSIASIDKLYSEYGDGWIHKWLSAKNLNLADYTSGFTG